MHAKQMKNINTERYFTDIARSYIHYFYKINCDNRPEVLLEIETIRAKTRFVLRTGEIDFINYKKGEMITNVTNSAEMRLALNENLHGLLTKKRKLLLVKE